MRNLKRKLLIHIEPHEMLEHIGFVDGPRWPKMTSVAHRKIARAQICG
jgi:hypothetical protein